MVTDEAVGRRDRGREGGRQRRIRESTVTGEGEEKTI